MTKNNFKIGFSKIGGIYIGKGVRSDFHKHYAIAIILSFGKPFTITRENQTQDSYRAAIIQKNIKYNLQSSEDEFVAFIHLAPYSEIGMHLSDKENPIRKLDVDQIENILDELRNWFYSTENDSEKVEYLLNLFSRVPQRRGKEKILIDERIRKSFDLISNNESEKLSIREIAEAVHLSTSHFARLFKKETGLTFREFVLHSKLVKSIYAMYKENNLTEASFLGGFADQPHFTRTFKGAFGIKPSSSRK